MAGEWFPLDADIGRKPETLELADRFDLEPATVVGRLAALWGWACVNCANGTERMTVRRMARLFGGDEDFWLAVEEVGWLVINFEAGTITIPAWERRFSGAAKERLRHRQRAATAAAQQEKGISAPERRKSAGDGATLAAPKRRKSAGTTCAKAQEKRSTGEDIRGQYPPPPPRESCADQEQQADLQPAPAALAEAWESLREAWAAQPGVRPWRSPRAPAQALERLAEAGWLADAIEAIRLLPACRYFTTPVDLFQLCGPGFVERVLAGKYESPKPPPPGPRRSIPSDERPPAAPWSGEDAARFEATKRALAERIRQEGAA